MSLATISTVNAGLGTPYSQTIKFGGYWFTRTDTTVNANTAIQLVCHSIYDTTLVYPFQAAVVNTLAAL